MNAQELVTAVEWNISVVTIVMNNNCWGSEKAYQKAFYGERYVGANLRNPRFDRLAELCGARGYYIGGRGKVLEKPIRVQRQGRGHWLLFRGQIHPDAGLSTQCP